MLENLHPLSFTFLWLDVKLITAYVRASAAVSQGRRAKGDAKWASNDYLSDFIIFFFFLVSALRNFSIINPNKGKCNKRL